MQNSSICVKMAGLFSSKAVIFPSTNKLHSVRSHFAAAPRKLLLYSKKGCCLCDGLKEKLHSAFLMGGPDSLADVQLEVRDITTNPEWEKAYQYEIPVLVRLLADGSAETLPRMSPRLNAEQVQKKLAALLA